ncbi:right-handed parallel beta-helix repeat-containing protein [Rapidithrix thailandica]|uniref:Right-handed parallel beta-helix repeat-containing protein n=1 Tax=Rapidithrix thailandica TaxID=413964 RepID=A0AAW9SI35_9BACT
MKLKKRLKTRLITITQRGTLILLVLLSVMCKTKKADETKNEIKYVTAESGLNYRDKPKGKKLGKLDFNQKIIVDTHSGVYEKIKVGNNLIQGEWVSTTINSQNVFVFNAFLADTISKSLAEINAEVDAVTEAKIKKIIKVELEKPISEVMDEYNKLKEEMYTYYRNKKSLSPGESILREEKLREKWSSINNENIKPTKDTVVITDEMSLLKNLKSNRVFLIDTPILNFHKKELTYNTEVINEHFAPKRTGTLILRDLKNVEFIGRKQRVYFICYTYGESLLYIKDLEKFVFKNFCFYYPTSESDREEKKENLNDEYENFYGMLISGKDGKFINCNIDGIGFTGVYCSKASNITFKNSTFTNIQKNVVALDRAKNIVLDNVTIKNNDCKSIIQLKDDEGIGSNYEEEIKLSNCKISNNKADKLLGFGKSFNNKILPSDVILKSCEIANNSFQRTFLNFNYKEERSARFYSCKIYNNKIFDVDEQDNPFFVSGTLKYSVRFKNTSFKNNDWEISTLERKKYFE